MDALLLAKALTAVAPVLLLLAVFDRLDSFNLITFRSIVALVATGGAIAGLSFLVNWRVMDGFPIGFSNQTRYISPVVEEVLKALPIAALFAANRIGFKIDAGIAGFAVGAGFSMIENVWYLFTLTDANFSAWLVRGFGTAIMHGGATALFAVIGHEFTEKQSAADAARYRFNPLLFLPGLGLAIAVHAIFNHFPNQPVMIMALTLLLTPMVLFFTFARNEHAARQWLAADADAHRRALEEIRSGRFAMSAPGLALTRVTARLGGDATANVFAYVELKTALVLRAEEAIHSVQGGGTATFSADDRAAVAQLDDLERTLGRTLLAAIAPYLGFSRNDLWELDRFCARVRESVSRS